MEVFDLVNKKILNLESMIESNYKNSFCVIFIFIHLFYIFKIISI